MYYMLWTEKPIHRGEREGRHRWESFSSRNELVEFIETNNMALDDAIVILPEAEDLTYTPADILADPNL